MEMSPKKEMMLPKDKKKEQMMMEKQQMAKMMVDKMFGGKGKSGGKQ